MKLNRAKAPVVAAARTDLIPVLQSHIAAAVIVPSHGMGPKAALRAPAIKKNAF